MGRAWLAASASVSRSGTPSASASRMAESAAAAPAGGTSFSSSPSPSSTVFTLSVWQRQKASASGNGETAPARGRRIAYLVVQHIVHAGARQADDPAPPVGEDDGRRLWVRRRQPRVIAWAQRARLSLHTRGRGERQLRAPACRTPVSCTSRMPGGNRAAVRSGRGRGGRRGVARTGHDGRRREATQHRAEASVRRDKLRAPGAVLADRKEEQAHDKLEREEHHRDEPEHRVERGKVRHGAFVHRSALRVVVFEGDHHGRDAQRGCEEPARSQHSGGGAGTQDGGRAPMTHIMMPCTHFRAMPSDAGSKRYASAPSM